MAEFWSEGVHFAFQQLGESCIVVFELFHVVAFELEQAAFFCGFLPSLVPCNYRAVITENLDIPLLQDFSVYGEDDE